MSELNKDIALGHSIDALISKNEVQPNPLKPKPNFTVPLGNYWNKSHDKNYSSRRDNNYAE